MPRRPERGVDHHRHEGTVEAVLLRQAGKSRVTHSLRDDERGDRSAGEEVEEQVGLEGVGREPADAWEDGGGVVQRAVGGLDARSTVGCCLRMVGGREVSEKGFEKRRLARRFVLRQPSIFLDRALR